MATLVAIGFGCTILPAPAYSQDRTETENSEVQAQSSDSDASESGGAIEQIVVTARKRTESLMDIPSAVSAYGFEEMDRRGFTGLEDVSDITPGMNYSQQGVQIPGRYNTAVRFRGLNTNQTAPSQQLGTVFLDGVYMSSGVQGIDFSNIERVEVIKGPQSATFGRSTFAGAVNFITRKPSFEYGGRASTDLSQYGGYDISVSHEGPVFDDKLAYRVSVRGYGTDGQYVSNADGGRLGAERTTTLQGTLYATPTDNFSATLRWLFSQDEDGPSAGLFLGGPLSTNGDGSVNAGTNCFDVRPEERANGAVSDYYCGELPQVNVDEFIQPNTSVNPFELAAFDSLTYTNMSTGVTHQKIVGVPTVTSPGLKRNQQNWALIMDYEFDDGILDGYTLSSLTGYSLLRASWVRDYDLTRVTGLLSQDPQLNEHISQELRISSPQDQGFRWSLGYSFFDVEYIRAGNSGMNISGSDGSTCQIVGGVCVPCPCIGGGTSFPLEGGTTTGVFGSFGFDFTDKLTLDLEWRYQEDQISQDDRTTPGVDFEDTFYALLPRVTLSYHATDSNTLWATYSEGNLPGFFNSQVVGFSEAELAAVREMVDDFSLFNKEEELINREIGWKQRLLDDQLYFSLVLYQLDWANLKTRQGVPIILDNGNEYTVNVQFNSGDAEMTGFELAGGFAIGDNFTAQFSVDRVEGEYGVFTCGFSPFKAPITPGDSFGPRDCSGNTPARYPDWSGSLNLAWIDRFRDSDWDYFIRGTGTYFGKAYTEEANFAWYGKFWRVNLRGGFEKDSWRIEGYVRNLFDDDSYLAASRWSDFSTGINSGFLFSQGIVATPAEKRTIGIKAVYEF